MSKAYSDPGKSQRPSPSYRSPSLAANRDARVCGVAAELRVDVWAMRGAFDGQHPDVCAPSLHPHPFIFHMI